MQGSQLDQEILNAIRDYALPLIEQDGGSVEVISIQGKTVTVQFSGTCVGCPGQSYTLGHVIGRTLRTRVAPDIVVTSSRTRSGIPARKNT